MSITHKIQPGTAQSWLNTGGAVDLNLASLADNAARQGESLDLGAEFAEVYGFTLKIKPGTAPTAGALARLALGFSPDGSTWPGGLSGADGALSSPADRFPQLQELRALVLRSSTDTQTVTGTFRPSGRYVAPAVWLDGVGAALDADGTAHAVVIWPLNAITE